MNPVALPFFDDLQSYGHFVLGFIAPATPYAALIQLGFLLYQMAEREPIANKLGDFGEFYSGYLFASAGMK